MIDIRILSWGEYLGLSIWALCNYKSLSKKREDEKSKMSNSRECDDGRKRRLDDVIAS